MKPCPRCAQLDAAAKLTLRPGVLDQVEAELDGIGAAPPGAVEMLVQFYRNVKAALAANGVRGGGHGQ